MIALIMITTIIFITVITKRLAKVIMDLDIKGSWMFSPVHILIQVIQKRKAVLQEKTFKIARRWYWKIIFY